MTPVPVRLTSKEMIRLADRCGLNAATVQQYIENRQAPVGWLARELSLATGHEIHVARPEGDQAA